MRQARPATGITPHASPTRHPIGGGEGPLWGGPHSPTRPAPHTGLALVQRRTDRAGRTCHWILEIHRVGREHRFGGFHEELLTL